MLSGDITSIKALDLYCCL